MSVRTRLITVARRGEGRGVDREGQWKGGGKGWVLSCHVTYPAH